jgi:succinoglycan biosynthesis protein ExoV
MKLTYFASTPSNFGDALNPYIWSHLLPEGFLDEDDRELFVGIGSILWDSYPKDAVKHVIGSGYGGYTGKPDLKDGTWNVIFLRGPRTAALFGQPPETVVCDGAVLIADMPLPKPALGIDVAFMPHFESIEHGFWQRVCEKAGVTFIDPRGEVEHVLSQIQGARLLVSEAMHGVIVADALRTPWIPIEPLHSAHRAKWLDWAEAMDVEVNFTRLPPTSLRAVYHQRRPGLENWRGQKLNDWKLFAPINDLIIGRAAKQLIAAAQKRPSLSQDGIVTAKIAEIKQRLRIFVQSKGFLGLKD